MYLIRIDGIDKHGKIRTVPQSSKAIYCAGSLKHFATDTSRYTHTRAESRDANVLTAASLTTARRWKQPKCPLIDDWINKCGLIYDGMLLVLKREDTSDPRYNVDEP